MFKNETETREIITKSYYICDICGVTSMADRGFEFYCEKRNYDQYGVGRISSPLITDLHLCPDCTEEAITLIKQSPRASPENE